MSLILTILCVSYAVVRATSGTDLGVSAPTGTLARDSELISAEQAKNRDLNATYDPRYMETLVLDADAMRQVLNGSYDDNL